MNIDKEAFFWQIREGKLAPPKVAKTLGIKFLKISPEQGEIEIEFNAKEEFTNPVGNIQGGFLAAMLDDTMGPALAATLRKGEFAPTTNLNIQFLYPARVGKIYGFGKVEKKGKKVSFLSGKLVQGVNVIATSTASALMSKL